MFGMLQVLRFLSLHSVALAVTISEINGPAFLSSFTGQSVSVTGLVTAIGPTAFYLRDTTSDVDPRTSSGIQVFTASSTDIKSQISVGDVISISGTVSEFRSANTNLFVTEIIQPEDLVVRSSGNEVVPVVVGANGVHPPTTQFSALDNGDVFGPNDQNQLSDENPMLQPTAYGLDFWESLSGNLITITNPVALNINDGHGDVWVRGDWPVTGTNARGGITMTDGSAGVDANPETIVVGKPLDGTKNSRAKQGDELGNITGVVTFTHDFYTILPLTALNVTTSKTPLTPDPTTLNSSGSCYGVTVGQYNVENLAPDSAHLPTIATHIATLLNSPDLVFLQEIGDNDGPIDDGVISGDDTLQNLVNEINFISGVDYSFASIDPINNQDGGLTGLNIRVSYLYNPDALTLVPATAGTATEAVSIEHGPSLSRNPGRIDPLNVAWSNSRKPLVAEFRANQSQKSFFAINVHLTSKRVGSTSLEGDPRPPLNGGVAQRGEQTAVLASFVSDLLKADPHAKILVAGDFNEFTFVEPMNVLLNGSLLDADEVVNRPPEERYTYLFEMDAQQLDHLLVSNAVAEPAEAVEYEHVHVNTWAQVPTSDHDPSVAKFNLC